MKKLIIIILVATVLIVGFVVTRFQSKDSDEISNIVVSTGYGFKIKLFSGWRLWSSVSAAVEAHNIIAFRYDDDFEEEEDFFALAEKHIEEYTDLFHSWSPSKSEWLILTNISGDLERSPSAALREIGNEIGERSGTQISVMVSGSAVRYEERDNERVSVSVHEINSNRVLVTSGKTGDPKMHFAQVSLQREGVLRSGEHSKSLRFTYFGDSVEPLVAVLRGLTIE